MLISQQMQALRQYVADFNQRCGMQESSKA